MSPSQIGHAADIEPDETIPAKPWQVQKKQPWPTLRRCMQFTIDHEYFIEMGEVLPFTRTTRSSGATTPCRWVASRTNR